MRISRSRVAIAQGALYVATGLSPFVSRRAFEAVTGPKQEWWLVETVGLLVTAIGAGSALAGLRGRVTDEMVLVAAGAAGSLAAIDVVHLARGRLKWTYGADAIAEAALVAAWVAAGRR